MADFFENEERPPSAKEKPRIFTTSNLIAFKILEAK